MVIKHDISGYNFRSGDDSTLITSVTDSSMFRVFRFGILVSWHQDNAYFHISDPMKGTALWTAVHQATIANGTMQVIPDSVQVVYEHSRDPYGDHHIRCYPPEGRPYLAGPQATGGLREYGVTVAGTWDQQVERMLQKQ
jgi:Phytanoyl-CoA dioxygenase (PhyH)